MSIRKILYGYNVQNGQIRICGREAAVVERIFTLYIAGVSYQKIADILNSEHILYSTESPLWNKHKVKRLLENPRYTGNAGYPPILETRIFYTVQGRIQSKKAIYVPVIRPILRLKGYLRCGRCKGKLNIVVEPGQREDTLYLKCKKCGFQTSILDIDLMDKINRHIAEHTTPADSSYSPSSEVIRLTNAINRGLEHLDAPEDIVALIMQGISARYECCPSVVDCRTIKPSAIVDLKHFRRIASHISIASGNIVTVHFK